MRAIDINALFNLNANHIFYFHQGNWYHNLKRFPGVLVDKYGYVRFETKEDFDTNPYLKHGIRLHIKNGFAVCQAIYIMALILFQICYVYARIAIRCWTMDLFQSM